MLTGLALYGERIRKWYTTTEKNNGVHPLKVVLEERAAHSANKWRVVEKSGVSDSVRGTEFPDWADVRKHLIESEEFKIANVKQAYIWQDQVLSKSSI